MEFSELIRAPSLKYVLNRYTVALLKGAMAQAADGKSDGAAPERISPQALTSFYFSGTPRNVNFVTQKRSEGIPLCSI